MSVARETCSAPHTSAMGRARSASNVRAISTCAGLSARGRPPRRPGACAAASPASVRARITARSNSAKAPNTWKMSRPPLVVVSIAWVSDRNPTPRFSSGVTRSMRCFKERPRRSRRQTTSVSPSRA